MNIKTGNDHDIRTFERMLKYQFEDMLLEAVNEAIQAVQDV